MLIGVGHIPQKQRLCAEIAMGEDGAEGFAGKARSIDHDGRIISRDFRYLKLIRPRLNCLFDGSVASLPLVYD